MLVKTILQYVCLRSSRSIRSTQDVALFLALFLALASASTQVRSRLQWFFAKLFLVYPLVFCLLVSILELSLVMMIYPFLRRAQAIIGVYVVSGLVCKWNLTISVSLYLWWGLAKYFADLFEAVVVETWKWLLSCLGYSPVFASIQ